jgi:preprotein translocase subunit SecE
LGVRIPPPLPEKLNDVSSFEFQVSGQNQLETGNLKPETELGSRLQVGSVETKRVKATTVADGENIGDRLKAWPDRTKDFLDEVRAEMKKVNYPGRKEVQATTAVVIFTVFVFAAFFWIVDTVIQFGLSHLLKVFNS